MTTSSLETANAAETTLFPGGPRIAPSPLEAVGPSADSLTLESCKAHLLDTIAAAAVGEDPFFHTYLEGVFPPAFYHRVRAYMLEKKHGEDVQDRLQDNPAFTNKRYNLASSQDEVAVWIRSLFSDRDVKQALLAKFYADPSADLADALEIHKEFEFFFTKAGRFQNIHVDIPPKFLSFVFYIPEYEIKEEDELVNGTILYDKNLDPHYKARFRANNACVFVPHFSSYHGFSSTIDRDVLVMFYINKNELERWRAIRKEVGDVPPFNGLLDAVKAKLERHPLLEFSGDDLRLAAEREACLVNAPDGRILRPTSPA